MQRPVVWLAALALVACSDRRPVDPTAPRPSPASANREVVVTDPDAAYGVMLNSPFLAAQVPLGTANFGQQVLATPGFVLDAQVVRTPAGTSLTDVVQDDGCAPFAASNIAGNIVLIDRGGCSFATKVLNAQNAGAIGVIIRDNVLETLPPRMAGDNINTPTIPVFSVTRGNGATIRNAILQMGQVQVQLVVIPVDAPSVHLPDDITTNATSSSGTTVSFSVFGTAYHDLGTVGCVPRSGSNFPVGTTTVTCSTVDLWSNTATGSFTVTVKPLDTTPPSISAPAPIVAELTGPGGASVTYSISAVDDDGQPVAVTCSMPSGAFFPLGSTAVNCTATDAAGNTANASFVVTVVDTTPPTLAMPAPVVADATSPAGAIVT